MAPASSTCPATPVSTVLGVKFEEEMPDGSVRPVTNISQPTLDSERRWNRLGSEAGNVVRTIKRLRDYLWSTKFRTFPDHKALESTGKVRDHNARV